MHPGAVRFHDESRCREIESFLVDRIYEFNVEATGYDDGRLLAGTIHDDEGEVIAGINGHTWGGCCEIAHVWVHERHRGQGLGKALMEAAESEAERRGCEQVRIVDASSFQAPENSAATWREVKDERSTGEPPPRRPEDLPDIALRQDPGSEDDRAPKPARRSVRPDQASRPR